MSAYYSKRTFNKGRHVLPISQHYDIQKDLSVGRQQKKRQRIALIVLVMQNSILVLMIRYSRNVKDEQDMYVASTAVVMAELFKTVICLLILLYEQRSWHRFTSVLRRNILYNGKDMLKMLVPSGLYALQNNLLYIALTNLDAATFQVTYQLKIFSTALFSILLLDRTLSRSKWLALMMLMLGVALVQWPAATDTVDEDTSASVVVAAAAADADAVSTTPTVRSHFAQTSPIVGLFAVIASCLSSGFAGCYFEKILKSTDTSMWVRNIQLGLCCALSSFVAMVVYDLPQLIDQGGMFGGYTSLTWCIIVNQALGGLLVAIVVKYADNILKGFATSLSVIVSGVFSVYLFGFQPSSQFMVGATLVVSATFLYNADTKTMSIKPM